MRFNRDSFVAILERSNYPSKSDFAKKVGLSPGALHDITADYGTTGKPRRTPSTELIRRLAAELKVPLPALLMSPYPDDERITA